MDTEFLAKTALFKNVPPEEIQVRIHCLGGVVRSYDKGTYIHYAGDVVHTVSMVLKGRVIIENDDLWATGTCWGRWAPGSCLQKPMPARKTNPC